MRRLAVVVLALRCVGARTQRKQLEAFQGDGRRRQDLRSGEGTPAARAGAEEVSGQCAELGLPTTTRDALAAAMVRIAAAETQRGLGASRYLENETDVRQNAPKAAEAIGLMRSAQYLTATAAVYEARARGFNANSACWRTGSRTLCTISQCTPTAARPARTSCLSERAVVSRRQLWRLLWQAASAPRHRKSIMTRPH
ncbi:hypothetical protein ERJ75_000780500 [Trypanosoma vivax]|nr:hypothetical protein ERJ75_000780500 [Trypanosoma vivax]